MANTNPTLASLSLLCMCKLQLSALIVHVVPLWFEKVSCMGLMVNQYGKLEVVMEPMSMLVPPWVGSLFEGVAQASSACEALHCSFEWLHDFTRHGVFHRSLRSEHPAGECGCARAVILLGAHRNELVLDWRHFVRTSHQHRPNQEGHLLHWQQQDSFGSSLNLARLASEAPKAKIGSATRTPVPGIPVSMETRTLLLCWGCFGCLCFFGCSWGCVFATGTWALVCWFSAWLFSIKPAKKEEEAGPGALASPLCAAYVGPWRARDAYAGSTA